MWFIDLIEQLVHGDGVAIVIHRRIKHHVLPSFNMKVFECLGIEVNTG